MNRGNKRSNLRHDSINEHGADYKDIQLLKMFLTETGKIVPARVTGVTGKQQRQLTRAIKQARQMALLSYTDQHAI